MGEGSTSGRKRHHHHKHSKHRSKHSKHSHSKHRHHRHHHHHKKRHKHHSQPKVEIDERLLQNALESLEVDVLKAIRVPEALDLLMDSTSQSDGGNSDSEDSDDDSSSGDEHDGDTPSTTTSKIASAVGTIRRGDTSSTSAGIISETVREGEEGASERHGSDDDEVGTKEEKTKAHRSCDSSQDHSNSKTVSKSKEVQIASGDEKISGGSSSSLREDSSKRIATNIENDTSKKSTPDDVTTTAEESKEGNKGGLKSPTTVTVVSNGAKVTYVNLKKQTQPDSTTLKSPSDEVKDSDVFGSETKREMVQDEQESKEPKSTRQQRKSDHKRSRRHSSSKSQLRSRSRSRSKTRKKSRRSRSSSRHKSHGHHHRRRRSRSYSRSPHRSHRTRSRSYSRSRRTRSPSPYRRRGRSRSRSPRRGRRGHRSRSRSRSHSKGSGGRRRSRSRRRHSRSPHHSRRSRSKSPQRRHDSPPKSKPSSRSKSQTPPNNDEATTSSSKSIKFTINPGRVKDPAQVAKSISSIAGGIVSRAKWEKISELTEFCEGLQKKQAVEDEFGPGPEGEGEEVEESTVRAPFNVHPTPIYQPQLIFHNNAWKTANQVMAETNPEMLGRGLEEQFPVSTGVQHQIHKDQGAAQEASDAINVFAQYQPVSVGDLVVKRLEASRQLHENPNDIAAQQTLSYIEQQTAIWAESKLKPGQFTGQQKIKPLTKDHHKIGRQAWAKKDMFHHLAPVMGGFGMKMLKKMGWEEGKPLGRMGEGQVEPIALDVKLNRSGLSTVMDRSQPALVPAAALQAPAKPSHLVEGKNPVSALQEICAKKRWNNPQYNLVMSEGPAHLKTFLFQVTVPLGTFQPATASNNKKQAKAQAAMAALQALGLVQKTIEYSASYS